MGGAVSRSGHTSSSGVHPGSDTHLPRAPSLDIASTDSTLVNRSSIFPPIRGPSTTDAPRAQHDVAQTQPTPQPAAVSPEVAALEAKVQALMGTVEQLQRQMLSMREEHETQPNIVKPVSSAAAHSSQGSPRRRSRQPAEDPTISSQMSSSEAVDGQLLDRLARLEGSVSEVKEALDGERAAKEFAKQLARVHQSGIPTSTIARPPGGVVGPMAGLLGAITGNGIVPVPEEVSCLLPPSAPFPKARSRSVNNRERLNILAACDEATEELSSTGVSLPPAGSRRRAGGQRMANPSDIPAGSSVIKAQTSRRRQTGVVEEVMSSLVGLGRGFPTPPSTASLWVGTSSPAEATPQPRIMRRSVGGNEGSTPVVHTGDHRLSPAVIRDANNPNVDGQSPPLTRMRASSPNHGSRMTAFLLPGGISSPTPSSSSTAAAAPIERDLDAGRGSGGAATHRLGTPTSATSDGPDRFQSGLRIQVHCDPPAPHPGEGTSASRAGSARGGIRPSPRGGTVSDGGVVTPVGLMMRDSDDSIIGLEEAISTPGGGGLNAVQRYGNVLPSDLALVEQMKLGGGCQPGPKQFL